MMIKRRELLKQLCLSAGSSLLVANQLKPVDSQAFHYFELPSMGSLFKVRFEAPESAAELDAEALLKLKAAVKKKLQALELVFSVHRPDSEALTMTRRLNRAPGTYIEVSQPMLEVLTASLSFSKQTQGVFDLTYGSVTNYWRYCSANQAVPKKEKLEELSKRVGFSQILIDGQKVTFKPKHKRVLLDFGGIAKGYAADQILKIFYEFNVRSVLIDLGGEIVAGEPPRNREGWPIGISNLAGDQVLETYYLKRAAMSTSGDIFQKIKKEGVHLSHIVNAKNLGGISKDEQITVVAKNGMTADVLSTVGRSINQHPFIKDFLEENTQKYWFVSS